MRCKSPAQADKILAAAARLFATHRFHEARMEDIAAQAEVGKGTVYRYFKDKDELYLALLRCARAGLLERLASCRETALEPRRRLVLLVQAVIGYFDEHPHLFDLITHAEAMYRPGVEFPWQEARAQTIDLAQEIFRAGTAAGLFRITHPDLSALLLLGGIRAVLRFGPTPRPADLALHIVSAFLGGPAERPVGVSAPLDLAIPSPQ